ncbi:GPW/gp25 family protein [Chitinophaga japonensis]|uniref:Phage baseplate assembly protein W n=1 Tax=Chitinophaga japonensis TaxID=104662 RepID=A0A562T539_CHIJA|nr:GPW/gp25 family protein [Chitinophaga japonensis]TWI88657.1 phage baseplate assembly protein W [Chitinophaga japonensis]
MKHQYYKLPLNLSHILQKKDMPVCSLEESVGQHIHLLITTVLGENKDDPEYGCQLWDTDFDIKATNNEVKEQVENAIKTAILQYEKRLMQVKVSALVSQEELSMPHGRKVKKKIKVSINGTLARNNNPFHYSSYFFVSPLSYD